MEHVLTAVLMMPFCMVVDGGVHGTASSYRMIVNRMDGNYFLF